MHDPKGAAMRLSLIRTSMSQLAKLTPRTAPLRRTPSGFADASRGTRHEQGYGTAWDRVRKVIMRRDAFTCQPCKREGRITMAHAVDHIVPKAEGGTDAESNLQAICNTCHRVKTQAEANRNR